MEGSLVVEVEGADELVGTAVVVCDASRLVEQQLETSSAIEQRIFTFMFSLHFRCGMMHAGILIGTRAELTISCEANISSSP